MKSASGITAADDVDAVIVLTTIGSADQADVIARALVEERLAACVNVLAEMTSVYRWQGAVEDGRERQLVIKTRRDRVSALRARLHELHTYELPEFLVVTVSDGSADYLRWIRESATGG